MRYFLDVNENYLMKVVYIVTQLLIGFTVMEISDSFLVEYNYYYEENNNPRDFIVFDFSSGNFHRIDNETNKIYETESLRTVYMNRMKEEILYTEKIKDTLFLRKFDCQVIAEHTRLEKPSIKTEKIIGDITVLRQLKLEDENYAYLPSIGNSIRDKGLFTFAAYFITDDHSTILHRVTEIEERQGFSEIATEMINLIK